MDNKEKKKKGKLGWVVSAIVIVVLFMAFSGAFDDEAAELTNNAYSNQEDIYVDKSSKTVELSSYAELSEEELIENLGVDKNDFGFYPNDSRINFMCVEGKVYMIKLDKNHEQEDSGYTLFGIAIGNKVEDTLYENLSSDFEFVTTTDIESGKSDVFVNKENGYSLAVDYTSDLKVIAVSYVLEETQVYENSVEDNSELVQENNQPADVTDIYGTYTYDNGVDAVITAEVGVYTDDGSNYIAMTALSYGDRYISEFTDTLEQIEKNTYRTQSDVGTVLIINFSEQGMTVVVESLGLEDDAVLAGSYQKTGEINLDEVG